MPKRTTLFYRWDDIPVYIDIPIVCRILGVDTQTVVNYIKQRGLPASKIGGIWRIDKEKLRYWIENHEWTGKKA